MDYAVRTTNLCKTFSVKSNHTTMFLLLKRKLLGGASNSRTIYALNDINIEIMKGNKIGIIGNNGSGKTTLLKVIAGLEEPNKGQVHVNGYITLLAGLGTGMVDELSVEENVFLYGAIYGMERKKIKGKLHDIIEWAELQDFVGAELRTLSSGMRARLAFSTMRHVETDIFLLDEALTAGDKNFKKKCEEYFENSKNNGKTFLISTHDLNFVKIFCTKTLWLHKGQQKAFGETEEVLQLYIDSKSG
ncbi:MAG TPA: ATP-binding cassette domain-containing protein [Thermodesulfobacteriota bacterium]|nr:ATP-binding cassette domain-containing protein [Thermodesulfobacteriota bacterium]